MDIKNIRNIVLFLLIGILLFCVVQNILTPDWTDKTTPYIIDGFLSLEEDSVDVLFLGTSHMLSGISPMRLYEDTRIRSYSLASEGQPIDCSYYMLKWALQYQKPTVVVLDASSLFRTNTSFSAGQSSSFWRYLMDVMPLDAVKIEMANAYAETSYSDGLLSIFFPIIKYHSRWNELSAKDFVANDITHYYSAGQYVATLANGAQLSLEDVSSVADHYAEWDSGFLIYQKDGVIDQATIDGYLYESTISESNLEYFYKIRDLCQEHEIKLLLTKIPVLQFPQFYNAAWTPQRSAMVTNLAQANGINFIDLLFDAPTDVNFQSDTIDFGQHLNFRGAEKVAHYIGTYLQDVYNINGKPSAQYDQMLAQYQKVRQIALLQSETSFSAYLNMLQEHKDTWSIFITASDEFIEGLTSEDFQQLDDLGLQMIGDAAWRNSYIAVINNGTVEYEALSDRNQSYHTSTEYADVTLTSSNWYTVSNSSIIINNTDYAANGGGLCFVIYDTETNAVLDSVIFNTYLDSKPATRDWGLVNACFRYYESIICFE